MNRVPSKKKPLVLITMGDPAGIGPEIILKTLNALRNLQDFCIFGDYHVLKQACRLAHFPQGMLVFDQMKRNRVCVRGTQLSRPFHIKQAGKVNAQFGQYSVKWIQEAVEFSHQLRAANVPHAIVTAPINKKSAHLSGFRFAGHTDFLSYLYEAPETSMMFYSKKLKVILVTIHCSLEKAVRSLNKDFIKRKIMHAYSALKSWGIVHPQILVAGCNPHAGEGGAFGREEKEFIEPAVKACRKKGFNVSGPYPPDTIFLKALENPSSCVVAMYHDQGLIPFKLLSFSSGVNVTTGLPVIRTSPDHGTAFDIAWKGIADNKSFLEAVKLALMSQKRDAQ